MTRLSFRFHCVLCVAVVLLWFAGIAAPAWAQFETRASRNVPGELLSIATGDFNSDGKLDVAVLGNGLSILLGNGDGTFRPPVTYSTNLAYSLAVADFNGDGKLDIVVANLGASTVDVFLGNGDGTFQAPISSNTTAGSYVVAVGDFNNDKITDLAIIDPPYISVLLGNGDGTFKAPSDNNSFVGPQKIAVGDFSNDHKLDVVVVGFFGGSQDVGILLGNGDGTLQPSLTYPLNNTPESVAAADFNHDGNLDVAISDKFQGIAVLLGKGDGSFQPEVDYPTVGGGGAVAAQDFNGDGNLDIVVMGGFPTGVSEFLGNGDGTFGSPQFCAAVTGGGPVVGDFNGDRKPDLALLGSPTGVTTMLNTGVISFSPTTPINFPVQLVSTNSNPAALTLKNAGMRAVSISSIEVSGQFQLGSSTTCEASVGPGEDCTISIVFRPLTAGRQGGLVTLVDGASSKPQVVGLSGRGTDLEVSPTSLTFGSQAVGTKSKPQKVTVANVSRTAVGLSKVGISGRNSQDFSQTNTCGSQLAGNASCTIEVIFAPTQKGARSGDLYFTVTLKDGSPASVILSGTGT